jgi:UDP-glucose 4-epimerase
MTILVTGGTGLVGSRLLRRFVDAGVDCRALVRPGKEVPAGATPVEGDLLDTDSLKQAVEGVSAIVHLAAVSGLRMRMTSGEPISMARKT